MAITKQQIIAGVIALLGILKPLATKIYKNWIDESPVAEKFLITITFGWYNRKVRSRRKKENDALATRFNNEEVDDKIDSYCQTLRDVYHFNRVTVSDYFFLGEGKFPENPVESDFLKLVLTITNECTDDNIREIKQEWQHRSALLFAKAMCLLHYSDKGYITIGPKDADDLKESQNLFGVIKSYRFKLGKGLFEGVLALSLMYDEDFPDLTDFQITHIKFIARKIYLEKLKYIYV